MVITDLGMPYVGRRQVARTVRGESPVTPVILLSGWSVLLSAEDSLFAHEDHILRKPPKMHGVLGTLSKVMLRGHREFLRERIGETRSRDEAATASETGGVAPAEC